MSITSIPFVSAKQIVKILLIDDHPLIRDGLKSRLQSHPGWTVCGEADTTREALSLIRELRPDVVIVDLSLKEGNGIDLIKQVAAQEQPPKILVCSMHDESLYAQRVIQAGALGFVHKQQASENIIGAVQKILSGRIYISEKASDDVLRQLMGQPLTFKSPIELLTDRELAVVEAIGQGASMHQIADMLHLSVKTVETYRERAKRKLKLSTAAELMRFAVKWSSEQVGENCRVE